jgi:uncharacterized membrane protein YcaP (DUF421 family)
MIIVLRVVALFFVVLVGLRILGKREFGQLSPIELVALLLVPELISQAIRGEDSSMTGAIISVATLLSIMYLMSLATHYSKTISKIVTAEPTIVVHNGKILKTAIDHERLEVSEIYTEMHKVGLERLEQVKWAILENDGTISIVPSEPHFVIGKQEEKKLR